MNNEFAMEEFGYWIDGTPYQMKADVEFDHDQFKDMVHSMLVDLNNGQEKDVYFYHSDHLGSASWITDGNGIPVQHLQYLPFGEPFVDQHPAGYQERFRFTGKERDEETGYGYFGARYMDHELTAMWLSVDPMADKYPSISPYAYCAWNPIKFVDPNGLEKIKAFKSTDKNAKNLNAHFKNYPENAPVIHLWAHGSTDGIECYDENDSQTRIACAGDMERFLSERSKVWQQNHQEGKDPEFTIIVLHSCHTGEGENPIAQDISTLENVLVVAPNTTVVGTTENGKVVEYGAASYKVEMREKKKIKVVDQVGAWNMYFKGKKVGTFKGDTKPIFTNPEKIQKQYDQKL